MVQEQPAVIRKCEQCGTNISKARLAAVPDARLCVQCQRQQERDSGESGRIRKRNPRPKEPEQTGSIEILEDRLTAGTWQANLSEIALQNAELRETLRSGNWKEAREIVQSQAPQVQAALVTLDENPEEILSLTGMTAEGKPTYNPSVVDLLPTEVLAELVVPRNSHYLRYNPEVIRAMSPQTFSRAVSETLDSVDRQPLRTKIVWDWMQAIASMDDKNKAATLLRQMDLDAIEDAVMDKIEELGLEKTLPLMLASDFPYRVSRLKALAEGLPGGPPGRFIDDPEIAGILDGLHEAAPELIGDVMKCVAERMK